MPPRPSLEEYRLLRDDKEPRPDNAIRVIANRNARAFVTNAIEVLNGEGGKTKCDTVMISGMGSAIHGVVNTVEIVKRRVVGLHQITEIGSAVVKDEYEPLDREVNPDNVIIERNVSTIRVTLSRTPLDTSNPGYQAPLPESEVTGGGCGFEGRRRDGAARSDK